MLYLCDHYLKEFDAEVVEVADTKSIVLDRTAIYARGGGQPSDRGSLVVEKSGRRLLVVEASKDQGKVVHILSEPISAEEVVPGTKVKGAIDWELRYKHMRHHTALHILSGVVFQKFGSRITGGQIYPERARLDFTLDDMSKERLAFIESEMNRIVSED